MSTHPYIPLYVDDFEAATAHLTPAEDGIYNRLLRLCWRTPGCSVPDDDAWIARKIRLSTKEYDALARPVIDEFFTRSRGRLFQKRLRDEYESITAKKEVRKNAGKSGGLAKARKTKENTSSNATVLPAYARAFPEPEPYKTPIVPKGTEDVDLFALEEKAESKPDDAQLALDAWNEMASRTGLAVAKVLSDARRRSIKARLKVGGIALWREAIAAVEASAFLRGQTSSQSGKPFRADLDFVCQEKSFGRLVEGYYGKDAKSTPANAPAVRAQTFSGPDWVRALILSKVHDPAFITKWLDPAKWDEETQTITASSLTGCDRLRQYAEWDLQKRGVKIVGPGQNVVPFDRKERTA